MLLWLDGIHDDKSIPSLESPKMHKTYTFIINTAECKLVIGVDSPMTASSLFCKRYGFTEQIKSALYWGIHYDTEILNSATLMSFFKF